MFLKQLQQPSIFVVLISLLVSAILWFMPVLFHTNGEINVCDVMFLNHFMLFSFPIWLSRLFAFVIVFVLLLWLNTLCEQLQILPSRSMIPLVLGVHLMAVVDYVQMFNAQLISFIFLFLALTQIFGVLHSSSSSFRAFNSVFLTLIASLFQPQYIWFFPILVLAMFFFHFYKFSKSNLQIRMFL